MLEVLIVKGCKGIALSKNRKLATNLNRIATFLTTM